MRYKVKMVGDAKNNWCAEITGRDQRYVYSRVFLPGYPVAVGDSPDSVEYDLEDGRIYEVSGWVDGEGAGRRFVAVYDGKAVQVDRDYVTEYANEITSARVGMTMSAVHRLYDRTDEPVELEGDEEQVRVGNEMRRRLIDRITEFRDGLDTYVAKMNRTLPEKVKIKNENEACCNRMIRDLEDCGNAEELISLIGNVYTDCNAESTMTNLDTVMRSARKLYDSGKLSGWAERFVMDYYR